MNHLNKLTHIDGCIKIIDDDKKFDISLGMSINDKLISKTGFINNEVKYHYCQMGYCIDFEKILNFYKNNIDNVYYIDKYFDEGKHIKTILPYIEYRDKFNIYNSVHKYYEYE